MNKLIKIVLLISLLSACVTDNHITIYLIGDSTMADKPDPKNNPERGWGQMLPLFFDENVTIKNYAVNGRSTKSFIDEGKWDTVLSKIKEGDYVFIQFGHNDQKFKDKKRYTNPLTGYRQNLIKFVKETRDKGGKPVLLSSIVRRNFNEFGVLMDSHGLYTLVVRQVAEEYAVPIIDLQLKSENLVLATGEEESKELYMWIEPGQSEMYPEGKKDNTHFTIRGATEMARLAVEGIKENHLDIVKYLKTDN